MRPRPQRQPLLATTRDHRGDSRGPRGARRRQRERDLRERPTRGALAPAARRHRAPGCHRAHRARRGGGDPGGGARRAGAGLGARRRRSEVGGLQAAGARDRAAPRRLPVVPPRREQASADTGLTLTSLAVLWGLSARRPSPAASWWPPGPSRLLTGVVAVGVGSAPRGGRGPDGAGTARHGPSWARHLQIAAAGLGLLVCPFTFASATVLLYMLRPDVRATFEGRGSGAGAAEPTFALSLLGMLALGLAVTAGAVVSPCRDPEDGFPFR